jgi:hypothetical protein
MPCELARLGWETTWSRFGAGHLGHGRDDGLFERGCMCSCVNVISNGHNDRLTQSAVLVRWAAALCTAKGAGEKLLHSNVVVENTTKHCKMP